MPHRQSQCLLCYVFRLFSKDYSLSQIKALCRLKWGGLQVVARQECMDTMRELFRQFMSVLIQEKVKVEEEHIYLDPRISFHEIDRYFLSGCACAYFQVAVDVYTDLRYNREEWE